ncbi:MAG: PAS domain-containing protein [Myxococcales bacterium]|nr:PAS domain-containing protein [Myxococcales bacterium]
MTRGDEYTEIVRQLAPRSSVTVPLVARGRTLGAVTFGMAESGRDYTEADISLAEELGRRAGVALDNALLFKAEARARAEANANRAQLEATLMAMSEGVVVLDMSGSVVLANDAQAGMIGYAGGDELKRDIGRISREFELFGLDGQPIAPENRPGARVLRGETLTDLEVRGRRKDTGEEWYISFSGAPVRDETGKQVLALIITRDITARKRAEAALREAIQVRDDFLSIAGHELRTPLAAMLMHVQGVERLARKEGAAPRFVERLGKASIAVTRLQKLVDELLDVSRIQSGRLALERERVDLVQLVREVVDRHADQVAEAGSAVDFSAPAAVVGVWDRARLDQAVTNLISNAIKYGRGKPVAVRLGLDGATAVLRVVDQGIGIPVAEQQRIFERFERGAGAREYGGIGLGLWIARQVVEASGGRIEVESEAGRGTTFTMTLPVDDGHDGR